MSTPTDKRKTFRRSLQSGPIVAAPGCTDALTARLIEAVGLPAAYLSGNAQHHVNGFADVNVLTMTEMVTNATAVANAISIPAIADGEGGFGTRANVARMVRAYERAGVAAIHIEDSMVPKTPPGVAVTAPTVSRGEFLDKIRAALDARTDESLVIVARSELKGDYAEKKERLQQCLEAGADAFWFSTREPDEISDLSRSFGRPGFGVLPAQLTLAQYESLGARCAMIPQGLTIAALIAQHAFLTALIESGTPNTYFAAQEGFNRMRAFYNEQAEGAD